MAEDLGTQRSWHPGREAAWAAAQIQACRPGPHVPLSADTSTLSSSLTPCSFWAWSGHHPCPRRWSRSDTCQPRSVSALLLMESRHRCIS